MFNNDDTFKEKRGPTKNIRSLKNRHCVLCGKQISLLNRRIKFCDDYCQGKYRRQKQAQIGG